MRQKETSTWWFCENVIDHRGQVGLLRMDFPRVFVLIRDYGASYFASFEEFKNNIAEINFFNPSERAEANLEEIIIEAWNFLAASEDEEERLYNENGGYED